MLLPIWGYSSLWKKRRQKIIIYYKNLPASVFAMSSPAYNMEAGMRHDLIDFVVFAVIGFQSGACEAHISSGNSASRRPDWRTADDAFCTVVFCFECLPESFNQFFFAHILIGSDCHFSNFSIEIGCMIVPSFAFIFVCCQYLTMKRKDCILHL